MKGSIKIVMKDVEVSDVLYVRTIIKKMLCHSICVHLSGVFTEASLKAAFSFTYVFLAAPWT